MMLNILCGLLPVAFLPGLISGATSPRWALMSFLIPIMLWTVDMRKIPHVKILAAILLYCAISIAWMEIRLDGYMELWHMALLVGVFAIGASTERIEKPLYWMALSVAITAPLAALQSFGYIGIGQVAEPAGLFINKNIYAEISAALLVAMILSRQWAITIALSVIVVLTQEKASFVALVVAATIWLWPRYRVFSFLMIVVLFVCGYFMLSHGMANSRIDIWADTIQGMTVLGNGIGSFWTEYPTSATHYDVLNFRPEHAHNEILHFLFEIGIIGTSMLAAVAYFAIHGRGAREVEYLVLVCILTESMFAFPLHMPTTAFLASLVAGRLCRVLPDDGGSRHEGRDCHA